jgi:hypothetical protein
MRRLSLDFAPLLPAWLLWSLAGLCLASIVLALLRRASGAVWRGLGLGLLLAWLSGPILLRQDWRELPQTLLLLVDRTGSMQVGRRPRRDAYPAGSAERAEARAAGRRGLLGGEHLDPRRHRAGDAAASARSCRVGRH